MSHSDQPHKHDPSTTSRIVTAWDAIIGASRTALRLGFLRARSSSRRCRMPSYTTTTSPGACRASWRPRMPSTSASCKPHASAPLQPHACPPRTRLLHLCLGCAYPACCEANSQCLITLGHRTRPQCQGRAHRDLLAHALGGTSRCHWPMSAPVATTSVRAQRSRAPPHALWPNAAAPAPDPRPCGPSWPPPAARPLPWAPLSPSCAAAPAASQARGPATPHGGGFARTSAMASMVLPRPISSASTPPAQRLRRGRRLRQHITCDRKVPGVRSCSLFPGSLIPCPTSVFYFSALLALFGVVLPTSHGILLSVLSILDLHTGISWHAHHCIAPG